jgi:Domain of unknown function
LQNPQSIIYRTLLTRGAFRIPCDPEGVDTEQESIKYENMSKSLITGAVLIASAAFVSIFTVSGVYKIDVDSSYNKGKFMIFIVIDVMAFICAVVSTSWLLHSALTNFHLKYRKIYFGISFLLVHAAINLFVLAFGLGGYIAVEAQNQLLANFILAISFIAVVFNVLCHPKFFPLILLAPYRNG